MTNKKITVKVELPKIICFGSGTVLVTSAMNKDGEGALILQEGKGTGVIGEYTSTKEFSVRKNDTILAFENTESLDVVIERLEEVKRMMEEREEQSDDKNHDRKCYDCDNYRTSYFCGYDQSICKIHGSLDMDQTARHPDTTAATCKEFVWLKPKGGEQCWNVIMSLKW